jgi:hypothetical protein
LRETERRVAACISDVWMPVSFVGTRAAARVCNGRA